MSYAEFQAFATKAAELNVEDRIELITYLVKTLPQNNAKDDRAQQIEKINTVLSKINEKEQLQYCDAGLESVREALANDTW